MLKRKLSTLMDFDYTAKTHSEDDKNTITKKIIKLQDLHVEYYKIPSIHIPRNLFQKMQDHISESIQLNFSFGGKEIKTRRRMMAFGDDGIKYSFAGHSIASKPWIDELYKMKTFIEGLLQCNSYNYCLVNFYEDGLACINKHKDNEPEIDVHTPISCLSLGTTRKFKFERDGFESLLLNLENQSLIVMYKPTNQFWFHSIPRETRVKTMRVSLTFRRILL